MEYKLFIEKISIKKMLTQSLCEKWRKDPLKSPITGRPLVKYGKDYMNFYDQCLAISKKIEKEEDNRIFREASGEVDRLKEEEGFTIRGSFDKENSSGERIIYVLFEDSKDFTLTSEKKELIIDMDNLGIISKEQLLDQYPQFTRLIDILESRFKVPRVEPEKGYNEIMKVKAPYFSDEFSAKKYIDDKSYELQTMYGGTVLYNFLAHEYGYCVPYILHLEYKYNSDKKGICELSKKQIEELSLTANRVTCELKGVREIEDCKGKGNHLIMIYTRVILPERKFQGKTYAAVSDNHMSMLIVNSEEKSVEYFDPEGRGEMSLTCKECLEKWIQEKYPSFKIQYPKEKGIQCLTSKGSCFVLNLLYFYLKMSNDEPVDRIFREVIKTGYLNDFIIRFIIFLSGLAEKSNLSNTIELFSKYESDMKRLSLQEPEYKE